MRNPLCLTQAGIIALATFGLCCGGFVHAQRVVEFPDRPIRIIIPFSPGGGGDIIGRTVGAKLQEAWGSPVVAENIAGANGTIGVTAGMKAAADGHTITLIGAALVINAHILPNVPYDLLRDFIPLSQLTAQPYALVVHSSLPVRNIKELIALARAEPGSINYGSSGIGGTSHLSGELFASMARIKLTHVPYKGGNPAMQDLLAGNIQLLFSTLLQARVHLKSGKLRSLGVTTIKRTPAAPELPTLAEAGVPDFEVAPWNGLLLPGKTPPAIVGKLNKEIARIMNLQDVAQRLAADGSEPVGSSSAQFGVLLKSETEKWGRVIKEVGIKMD